MFLIIFFKFYILSQLKHILINIYIFISSCNILTSNEIKEYFLVHHMQHQKVFSHFLVLAAPFVRAVNKVPETAFWMGGGGGAKRFDLWFLSRCIWFLLLLLQFADSNWKAIESDMPNNKRSEPRKGRWGRTRIAAGQQQKLLNRSCLAN